MPRIDTSGLMYPKPAKREKRQRPGNDMLLPKQTLTRSKPYRKHIASLPCAACGREGETQAAHFRLGQQAGMSRKPGDDLCVALCVHCHRDQGERGEERFWRETVAYMKREKLADIIAAWRRQAYREWEDG